MTPARQWGRGIRFHLEAPGRGNGISSMSRSPRSSLSACFNFPSFRSAPLDPTGRPRTGVVNKIQEFATELADPASDLEEQIVALKFLLHFMGDAHQPLHDSDDSDRGGNAKRVSASGLKAGNLHHYWGHGIRQPTRSRR
jgi:hypothetical protein